MRILHINDVASVGTTLVAGLGRLGHQAELRRLRLIAGGRSTTVKLLALPVRLLELASVERQVSAGCYDVVHIHYAYLGCLGVVGGYPYFLHCHGSDVRNAMADPIRRWPMLLALRHARSVLLATPDLASHVQTVRPDAAFLPNPVCTDDFRPMPSRREWPSVLLISAFSRTKNVQVAIEAVQLLLARYPETTVTAIDYGPDRHAYQRVPGLRLVPPVAHSDMPALINAHDIVVGQFGIGSLGMAELESLACGKPVICHWAYADAYHEAPPVFATDQASEAADHLLALVEDATLRKERGEQGRAWVERFHGYLEVARRLERLYADRGATR